MLDIVSALSDSFPHLSEYILCFLDVESLARAELVCKAWREAILHQKIWKKILLPRLSKLPTWLKLENWINLPPDDEEVADSKKKWTALYCHNKALNRNWRSGTFTMEEIMAEVHYFTMNSTHIITTEGDAIKFWNRKSLICEKEFTEKGRNIVGLDCDDSYLITSADRDCSELSLEYGGSVISIVCRSLKSDDVIFRVVEGRSMISSSGVSWGCHEALFKVRFKHNLLVSHRLIPSSNDRENPERSMTSCLKLRRFDGSDVDSTGTTRELVVDAGIAYPTYIGHDDRYVVVHYHDPPRFELISSVSHGTVRTIDSLDNCSSVQYGNGLIVSASAQMGTHTRTTCVIRLWDVETGDCIREIFEPEPSRYHNLGHQVAFNSRFLVSVPDLPNGLPRILKIRDLQSALNSGVASDQLLLATHSLDWSVSTWDFIVLDEFQIVYFHDPTYETSSLYVFSLAPSS